MQRMHKKKRRMEIKKVKRKRKRKGRSQILTQGRILGNLGKNTKSRKPTVHFLKKEKHRKQKRSRKLKKLKQ